GHGRDLRSLRLSQQSEVPMRAICSIAPAVIEDVARRVRALCGADGSLPFHGWHHVSFVRAKAVRFALANGSDAGVVETAALVHDLNYLVRRNSPAAAGREPRLRVLADAG